VSLHLGFEFDVEDLHLRAILQGNDLGDRVHDGRFGADWAWRCQKWKFDPRSRPGLARGRTRTCRSPT
jgi:hypothetical protein